MSAIEKNKLRLDSEWVTVNALRELIRLATRGDHSKATYNHALELGAQICPALLGKEVSLLQRSRESDVTREYRQRAEAMTRKSGKEVSAVSILEADISEYRDLLTTAKGNQQTDQLRRRLKSLKQFREELVPLRHSENQLIFRDAYNANHQMPSPKMGHGFRDFTLPDENIMRLRVFHPDRPEHLSGADLIYEKHDAKNQTASLVAVQYKIWDDRRLLLSDTRMSKQLDRLRAFTCKTDLCVSNDTYHFRFPFCAAFLRPTDRLQNPDQTLISSGEHLPICQIDRCSRESARAAKMIHYEDIRNVSLSQDVFEHLFSNGKIGSRTLSFVELEKLYEQFEISADSDRILIHAQDFDETWAIPF